MANYDLAFPGAAIDAILTTAYDLQNAGYIFKGSATNWSGTPTQRTWLLAPAGFSGYGFSSAIPKGSIGICRWTGSAWSGDVINVVTIDSTVTNGSTNPVSGDAVWDALDELATGIRDTLLSFTIIDGTASADQASKLTYDVKMTDGQGGQHLIGSFNILAATAYKAGLMSAADKAKVDAFLDNLRSLSFTDTTPGADVGTKIVETLKMTVGGVEEAVTALTILAATTSKAGLMSAADKTYIDGLPSSLTSINTSISKLLAMLGYYECSTAAATAAKTVSASGYVLTTGGCIRIKMTNANTADNVTLNINSTGAKALYYDGAQASSSNSWEAGEVLEVYYDGTQYQCASGGGGKFATGQKVKEISLLDALDGSGNIPKSVTVKNETDNLYANIGLFECQTAKNTAAKVVSATGYKLTTGGHILVNMTNENTAANPTLNINSTGAKPLFYYGERASSTNSWKAGDLLVIYYDGTNYISMLYDIDAKHVIYDGTLSGLPSNVQEAIDSVSQSIFEVNPPETQTSGLRCESTNTSLITVSNTSANNYEVHSITRTSGVYGKIYLPAMVNGLRYRMSFTYTNSNTGSQDWSIRSSRNIDLIRPTQMVYTLEQMEYSFDFEYTSDMSYLNFFCNNMVDGSTIAIYNLQFICLESYDNMKETVRSLSNAVDSILPAAIDTKSLACNSTDTTKMTIACVSDNNYLINCIERTGGVYGYIALPDTLVVGKQYRISFIVTTDNEYPLAVALSTSTGTHSVIYRYLQQQKNGLFYFDFVHRESNYTSNLRFFCNDMRDGKSIALNDMKIFETSSLTAVCDEVYPEESNTLYVYPATRKIDLKTVKNYELTVTNAAWSIPTGQTLAFYGDYIVRIPTNGKLTLLRLSGDTVTTVFESPDNLQGHNNSAQFAPYKGENDEFPLLYVSAFTDVPICKVYRLTTESVTLVQTITFNLPQTILAPVYQSWYNSHIGDDGCLYIYNFETGVVKLTTPSTAESVVELDINNVLDFFRFNYPYVEYVTQGGVIHKNMLFMPCGYSSQTFNEIFVFDLAAHTLITKVNIGSWNGEPEDCDIRDGKLYVSTLTGAIRIVDFL